MASARSSSRAVLRSRLAAGQPHRPLVGPAQALGASEDWLPDWLRGNPWLRVIGERGKA